MPDTAVAVAPGRVNLIGEHTDYHEGFVLPTLIPQHTHVSLRRRSDNRVHAVSAAIGSGRYSLGEECTHGGWLDYLQGVTVALARRGLRISGFEADIESDIPVGAGVSSSAALTVALLRALRTLFDLQLDDVEVALIARAAEADFVGAPVGIMDQMACSVGRAGEALFLDTRSLHAERVRLPAGVVFPVIDSGVTHQHAGGGYVERRRESFEAAAALGVAHLRDVEAGQLPRLTALPPLLARRARHIITENQRVLDAVDALRAADAPRLGALFTASHRSLRDDYEVSTADVDRLVEIAHGHPSVLGARLTGGGFGGAVVMVMRPGGDGDAERIARHYSAISGRTGRVLATVSA